MLSHKKTIFEALGRGPVHPFPARMAPGIALDVLARAKGSLRILDPMMGSGTVLAVARSKGHRAIGLDIDPLSVLISSVWTRAIDVEEARSKAAEVLDRAREAFANLPTRGAYPNNADEETKRFVVYWFDAYSRRQLASLSAAIRRVRDVEIRDVLWCAFSRLIIAKQAGASLAMDLSHSRPHKSFEHAPSKPFPNFLAAVERVLDNSIQKSSRGRGPAPRIEQGDARELPLKAGSVDLVLTSPPYLNAIDYMRCSKFSLVWMGHSIGDLRGLRSTSVGTEVGSPAGQRDPTVRHIKARLNMRPQLKPRDEAVLDRYIDDMKRAVGEVARVLVPKGRAVYVVGENTIRGTYVRNSLIVAELGKMAGLKLVERRVRALPASRRYLPPPVAGGRADGLDARIRREAILVFTKRAH
jgi:DNA modification methylase